MGKVIFYKTKKENLKEAEKLKKIILKLLKPLNMDKWTIKLTYNPNPESEDCAEVKDLFPEYKSARIVCYNKKTSTWKEILMHELFHCKIGILVKNYDDALDNMLLAVKEAIGNSEEQVVEGLTKCFMKYGE